MKLRAALQRVTHSGLIRNVEFEYESLPENDADVVLYLKCMDEKPSAKASISIPKVNEEDVWTWLAQIDPLFTKDMPPTEPAVRIYSNWIAKFMEGHGDPKFQENFAIVADGSSSTGGAGSACF